MVGDDSHTAQENCGLQGAEEERGWSGMTATRPKSIATCKEGSK